MYTECGTPSLVEFQLIPRATAAPTAEPPTFEDHWIPRQRPLSLSSGYAVAVYIAVVHKQPALRLRYAPANIGYLKCDVSALTADIEFYERTRGVHMHQNTT